MQDASLSTCFVVEKKIYIYIYILYRDIDMYTSIGKTSSLYSEEFRCKLYRGRSKEIYIYIYTYTIEYIYKIYTIDDIYTIYIDRWRRADTVKKYIYIYTYTIEYIYKIYTIVDIYTIYIDSYFNNVYV